MTNDTQPSVKFEGEVDIKRRSTPMTNDTRPSVRPVVGHHAKLRNGVIVPNIRIDPPDTRYWSEAFVTVCTWDENGKSSEYSDFDIIATISPADMQAVASGELERLRAAMQEVRLIAVDAQLRATYQRTALESISAKLRTALEGSTV